LVISSGEGTWLRYAPPSVSVPTSSYCTSTFKTFSVEATSAHYMSLVGSGPEDGGRSGRARAYSIFDVATGSRVRQMQAWMVSFAG
jgi:hypothetical protein